jgi:hypothetical protein
VLLLVYDEFCLLWGGDHIKWVSNVREVFKSDHMDSFSWVGNFNSFTPIIHHHSNSTFMKPGHKNVFVLQTTFLHNDCCSYLAGLLIHIRLDDNALSWHRVILLQIDACIRHMSNFLHQ